MGTKGLLDTLEPTPRGVVFDYGNTLIPFGRREMSQIGQAIVEFLCREIPGTTPEAAKDALGETWVELHRQRMANNTESDPRDVIRGSFRRLGAVADEEAHVDRGVRAILDSFVASVSIGDGVHEVLGALRDRGIRLGFLSNYSLSEAIHVSAERIGIRDYFDVFVVSADLGLVKPHPELFLLTARRMELEPAEVLFVGDNPRADIAGAAAVGMRTAHTREYLDGRYHFDDPDEDQIEVRPDLVLDRLTQLTRGE